MLREAGFGSVGVNHIEGDPMHVYYIYVSDNAEGASGRLLDSPELRSASDHLPIVTELTV